MRNLLALGALVTLPGCMIFDNPFVGIWLVEVGQLSEPEETLEIDENFVDASPREDADVDSEWVYTDEVEVSDAAGFAYIERTSKGELVMIAGDDLFVGDVVDGVATFSWTYFSDGTERDEHESGYFYEEQGRDETTVSYRFEKDTENGGLKGRYTIASSTDIEYRETDEWTQEVGFITGNIPGFVYLEGKANFNDAREADCSGSVCELSIRAETTRSAKVKATATKFDEDAYENLEDALQPAG